MISGIVVIVRKVQIELVIHFWVLEILPGNSRVEPFARFIAVSVGRCFDIQCFPFHEYVLQMACQTRSPRRIEN